jgi:rhodanese-related sulfurtransferase
MLLQRSRDSHEVLVVDVRSTRRYHRSHIPNTHHIPSGKLVSGELPDFDLVLVADDEESAQKLAESLYDAGFRRRIMYLQGASKAGGSLAAHSSNMNHRQIRNLP